MKTLDLSQKLSSTMPVYPGTEQPQIHQATTIEKDGFAEKLITFYSHTGTHLDAPAHLFSAGKTLDQFESDKFFGRGVVLNAEGRPGNITRDEVEERLDPAGEIDFLLVHTGWSRKWGDPAYFEGFPVFDAEAAHYLAERGLQGVGIDAISVDPVGSTDMPNHRILLKRELIIVENLANLERLAEVSFHFCCFPLYFQQADGSPIRAVALVQ